MSTPKPARNSEENPDSWKCLIVCCDGTGQAASHGQDVIPSNVARFARALQPADKWPKDGLWLETQQVVLYQTGVGTDAGQSPVSAFFGEAFGSGLDIHVLEAYHFFVHNFEEDDKLFLFGFSRGAFTARAIASFITNVGLLKKEYIHYLPPIYEAYKTYFRPNRRDDQWLEWRKANAKVLESKMHLDVTIPIMGLWDTVGSLGVPETRFSQWWGLKQLRSWVNDKYAFHDMALTRHHGAGKSYNNMLEIDISLIVLNNRLLHSMSIVSHSLLSSSGPPHLKEHHKKRHLYQKLIRITQSSSNVGSQASHSDIGGGYGRGFMDISDLSFTWMMDKCRDHLTFNLDTLGLEDPSEGFVKGSLNTVTLKNAEGETLSSNPWGLSKLNNSYNSFKWKAAGSRTRKPGEYYTGQTDADGHAYRTNETFHPSVRRRLMANLEPSPEKWEKYLPPALHGFTLANADDGRPVYVKQVKGKHGREPFTIAIPESDLPDDKWEIELIKKDNACLQELEASSGLDDGLNKVLASIPKGKSAFRTALGYLPFVLVPVIATFVFRTQVLGVVEYLIHTVQKEL